MKLLKDDKKNLMILILFLIFFQDIYSLDINEINKLKSNYKVVKQIQLIQAKDKINIPDLPENIPNYLKLMQVNIPLILDRITKIVRNRET